MGVDANSLDIDLADELNKHALRLGATYSLSPDPDRPEQLAAVHKIPRQLFGGGYFFGLTPRLQGGIDPRLDGGACYRPLAAPGVLSDAEQHFAILPSPTTGPRRFLRNERMERPIIATPQTILDRVFDGVVDGVRETAEEVIVRSKPDDKGPTTYVPLDQDAQKNDVKSSWRILIPPSVSAEFADCHGVFDDSKALATYRQASAGTWQAPRDGLSDIDYDEPAGGFPVYSYSASNRGGLEAATNPLVKPSGDAVFRPRIRKVRREPYYPDPAVRYLVIAVRILAGRLLPGDPLVVPVRPPGVAYPEVRPLMLDVVAMPKRDEGLRTQERVLGLQIGANKYLHGAQVLHPNNKAQPAKLEIAAKDANGKSGKVAVSRVQVSLEPGESFELDIWCLPADEQELARWFDAVELAALVASVDAESGKTCVDCRTFERRLEQLNLRQLADQMRKLELTRGAANSPICTKASASLPLGALFCVAKSTYELLRTRPTPELAARTTLRATHAIAQPYSAPSIDLRLSRSAPIAAPTSAQAEEPKQTVIIGGAITVDRPTTGLFQIMAEGASLVSNAFDDELRRHRTPDEVARGLWPESSYHGRVHAGAGRLWLQG